MEGDVTTLMLPDEMEKLDIQSMSEEKRQALYAWGMRMFTMGQQPVGDIDEIKYGGNLVILEDGTRWEVDEAYKAKVKRWGVGTKVVIVDDEMYRLNEEEMIPVEQDLG
jgi:hypothetical protein